MGGIRPTSVGTFVKSISISPEFFHRAKDNNISLSEAVRVGISVILAEKGVKEYDNRLNLYRRMKAYQTKVQELSAEIEGIKERMGGGFDGNSGKKS